MRVQAEARVTIRVDKSLKEKADSLFNKLGLNMSTAFNMFLLKSIDEKAIPFKVSIGEKSSAGIYSSDDTTERFALSVAEDIAEYKARSLPVAKYDKKAKKAYLEYGDGRREYV